MKRNDKGFFERGGVSIFIVIFTALMITVIAASFTQIMLRSEQQSSTNDLSQSAYDSAMAGVEDAKRALIALRKCELEGLTCATDIRNKLESANCEQLEAAGVVDFNDGEVQVGQEELNQAYTCVKVELETDSYVDEMPGKDMPVVIPLKSKPSNPFTKIRISWFNHGDFEDIGGAEGGDAELPSPTGPPPQLPPEANWPATSPALMRAQLIQFTKGSINLDEFNVNGTKSARTLFLHPSEAGASTLSFVSDSRTRDAGSSNKPVAASCDKSFGFPDAFACQVTIELPAIPDREAYLQLQTYYQNQTSYKVELLNGSDIVQFDNVQPQVDSTGRASDLFRRVKAYVSLRNKGVPLQYPNAALSVEDGICKNYFFTDRDNGYNRRADAGC